MLDNRKSVLTSFAIETREDELDLYTCILVYKFMAGSYKCSTKPLSILLTKLLTYIKHSLQKYCETAYSRSGINQI